MEKATSLTSAIHLQDQYPSSLIDPVLYDSDELLQCDDAFDFLQGNNFVNAYLPGRYQCQQDSPSMFDMAFSDSFPTDLDDVGVSSSDGSPVLVPALSNTVDPLLDVPSPHNLYSPTPLEGSWSSPEQTVSHEINTTTTRQRGSSASGVQPSTSRRTSANKVTKRIPHAQVERRYRETINKNMERLRRALPLATYTDCDDSDGGTGESISNSDSDHIPPKISKAAVLSSAVEHIRKVERERTSLAEQNSQLSAELTRMRNITEILSKRLVLMQLAARRGNSFSSSK